MGRPILRSDVDRYDFQGIVDRHVLVVGGVHGSERAGVEVVHRVMRNLTSSSPRQFSSIVVPILFRANYARASRIFRSMAQNRNPRLIPDLTSGRHTALANGVERRDPNRNFPKTYHCYRSTNSRDAVGDVIEPENLWLMDVIANVKPVAIVSVHAIRTTDPVHIGERGNRNLPGIFVDPVTTLDISATRADPQNTPQSSDVDAVALAAARFISSRQSKLGCPSVAEGGHEGDLSASWVAGNWLNSNAPTARYARQGHDDGGISLGEWAPRAVIFSPDRSHLRPGIPVFTVEIKRYYCSTDYLPVIHVHSGKHGGHPGDQVELEHRERELELQAHADAITEVLLQCKSWT